MARSPPPETSQEAAKGRGAARACSGVSQGLARSSPMSGANWEEVVEELRPPAAAGVGAGNETDLARDETNFAPLSQSGAEAVATSSGALMLDICAFSLRTGK